MRKGRGGIPEITDQACLNAIESACRFSQTRCEMPPESAIKIVQKAVQKAAFLERTEEKLDEGISILEDLRESCCPMTFLNTPQAAYAFSAENAVCSALLMLTAMRERRETRGAHLRLDYTEKKDDGMGYVTFDPAGKVVFGSVEA